jgi:tRNA pseudouridine synthase 10
MLEKLGTTAPLALTYCTVYDFSLESGNIYVKGNYLKYSRTLSQTPWTVDGQKLYATSLQDEIAKELVHLFDAEDIKFHSGGREDIDVRMLGKGRPFMI